MSTMNDRDNVAVWFELPAGDLDRAQDFYEAILGTKLDRQSIDGMDMAVFPYEKPNVSGAIIADPDAGGRSGGAIVYLNCNGRLQEVADRVAASGGTLLTPRIDLPGDMGAFFQLQDTEGNRVGIHAVA